MAATDILKEYLVRLGFQVDTTAQAKIKQALREIENQLDRLSMNKSVKVLTHGMLAYAGAIGTVVVATGAMMSKVASADMEYQKLALRMHMTKDAAKAVTIAQKELNASFEEIAWIPELREQYKELRDLVRATSPDDSSLKTIRGIMFEFTKMKVIVGQGIQWIVYHLSNMFGGSLEGTRKKLSDFTKWLKDNIQIWTKWIAGGISIVINAIRGAYEIGKKLYILVKDFIGFLPSGTAAIIAFGTAITAAFMLNPVIAGLTLLFGILHEWWVWQEGKKKGYKTYTIFGDIFENLSELSGPLGELKSAIGDVLSPTKGFDWWKTFDFILNNVKKSIIELIGGIGLIVTAFQMLTEIGSPGKGTPEQEKAHSEKQKAIDEKYQKMRKSMGTTSFIGKGHMYNWRKETEAETERYKGEIGVEEWKGKVGERLNKFLSMTFDTEAYLKAQRSANARATGAQIGVTPSATTGGKLKPIDVGFSGKPSPQNIRGDLIQEGPVKKFSDYFPGGLPPELQIVPKEVWNVTIDKVVADDPVALQNKIKELSQKNVAGFRG